MRDERVGGLAVTIAGRGEPVLLVHGLGGSRRTWRHLLPSLAATHTVIAVDLAGHGDSDEPGGDYSVGAHAAALRDLVVRLGYRRVTVVGHSLGGGIAMQFAYQFPDRVDRLVLIGSGGLGRDLTMVLRAATLPGSEIVVAGFSHLPGAVTRHLVPLMSRIPGCVSRHDAAAVSDAIADLRHAGRRHTFIKTAQTVIDWSGQTIDATRHLTQLGDLPTLVIWGSDDRTIPPAHQSGIVKHLAHAHLAEIADAGHYPHETHTAAVLPLLQHFLATAPAARHTESRWRRRLILRPTSPLPAPTVSA
ncbi:pimeloyl-ACP methyl ester carboxylesterase [Allocatelliglobosispora scoriae]|uniref:Pimeloyl-ACP methyl ester carboxylesterase n=1 Tax=Allocatelliglobosispora scoriae TaxID=643052 RepID=A0A841BJH7_9ACTN|nr:alpha/beta fold hydrolase [Allocatelliglobosispora scoriae]MBB5867356.1 pimeloyl-ACP methyl ester carboxylesterase [Allocatelliglobosispora scoriae]